MTAASLNFDKENSVEIGSTFIATIQISDCPNLSDGYAGICHIRTSEDSPDITVTATITILGHDTFELKVPYTAWTSAVTAGNYRYDVLFNKATDRFYGVRGSMVLVKPVTRI